MSNYVCHSLSYLNKRFKNHNSSFILLGHSMGGVISMFVPFMKLCENVTISEIITLSSPLKVPPFSINTYAIHMENIYQYYYNNIYSNSNENKEENISKYMKELYYPLLSYKVINKITPLLNSDEIIKNKIENITFLSLISDFTDTNIYRKNSDISSFIPKSHGITVYLSNIKELDHYPLITDHYSILWCHESSVFIGEYLYDIINKRNNKIFKKVNRRMNITLEKFESGLIDKNENNKLNHLYGYNIKEISTTKTLFRFFHFGFQLQIDILPSILMFILFLMMNHESWFCRNSYYFLGHQWFSDLFTYYKKFFSLILLLIILSFINKYVIYTKYLIRPSHLLFLLSFGYIAIFLFDVIINISRLLMNNIIICIAFLIPMISILISYYHVNINMKYLKNVNFYDWNCCIFYVYIIAIIFDVYIKY